MAINIRGSPGESPVPICGTIDLHGDVVIGTVNIAGTLMVSGSVGVSNFPTAYAGTQYVHGSVGVSELPSIIGTVELSSSRTGSYGGTNIYGTAVAIADANSDRVCAAFRSLSDGTVCFGWDASVTADVGVATSGYPLFNREILEINQTKLWKGSVYAVAPAGAGPIAVNKLLF
jgi:hypothetical protein